jgi:UDP-N-acetylglucosamine 2-epimerase
VHKKEAEIEQDLFQAEKSENVQILPPLGYLDFISFNESVK